MVEVVGKKPCTKGKRGYPLGSASRVFGGESPVPTIRSQISGKEYRQEVGAFFADAKAATKKIVKEEKV